MYEKEPLVFIIVLNFNGINHLKYCLPSILKTSYKNCKVVIIDNNSQDDSMRYVKDNYPSIEVIGLDENIGWAGGNNIGIQYALKNNAKYVLLANNDIRVHPNWVSCAVEIAENDLFVGFVGFDVFGAVKPAKLESYYQAKKEWNSLSYYETNDFIDGMALFVPTNLFVNLGMIDEIFFMYGEETDLEIRGKAAGYKRIKTNIPVWHFSQGTSQKYPLKTGYLAIRNNIRLSIKHCDLLTIIKTILGIYLTGCNPFLKDNLENVTVMRLRPKGIIFNFFLISYCILWNIINLSQTLKYKQKDYQKIYACKLHQSF